jgi:signal transduction histidine kinase
MRERIPTGRLRRRLTIAFALVAGLSALALAAGSYAVVRQARLDDSVDRALAQTRFNLGFATEVLDAGSGEQATTELLAAFERRGDFDTVGTAAGRNFSSSVSIDYAQVPDDLRGLVQEGQLAYKRTELGGEPSLVVGGEVAGSDAELYFVFSERNLQDELAQLRTILLVGVLILALVGTIVGTILARRTLAPVGRASEAARSLAEGLLETRIPVESADEFGAWAVSFNEMADALEAKITALSEAQARERRFTSDVAHELRTPLTALVGEAELLGEHLDRMPADARRPAELLIADVARLRRLVEDLMEISRLDASSETVQHEPVDIAALVSATVGARGWRDVRIEADDGAVAVTDPRRLERIVANLVGNAVEHGGGNVTVRVGANGTVEVSDTGPGIPADHLPHVFERFYKADRARTGGGSGLGLAIALENARLLGAQLDAWSEAGLGTRFTLRLPVTKPLHDGERVVAERDDDDGQSPRRNP